MFSLRDSQTYCILTDRQDCSESPSSQLSISKMISVGRSSRFIIHVGSLKKGAPLITRHCHVTLLTVRENRMPGMFSQSSACLCHSSQHVHRLPLLNPSLIFLPGYTCTTSRVHILLSICKRARSSSPQARPGDTIRVRLFDLRMRVRV